MEDKSDTFRALYRHAIMPLKPEGRAVMRLDHSGKDVSRGQRGSSGKADDVDAVWSLTRRNPTTFDLRRTHSRTNDGADHVALTRLANPLRHEAAGLAGAPSEADDLARQLDVLGVPWSAGKPTCRDALKAAGITAKKRAPRAGRSAAQGPAPGGGGSCRRNNARAGHFGCSFGDSPGRRRRSG